MATLSLLVRKSLGKKNILNDLVFDREVVTLVHRKPALTLPFYAYSTCLYQGFYITVLNTDYEPAKWELRGKHSTNTCCMYSNHLGTSTQGRQRSTTQRSLTQMHSFGFLHLKTTRQRCRISNVQAEKKVY